MEGGGCYTIATISCGRVNLDGEIVTTGHCTITLGCGVITREGVGRVVTTVLTAC